MQVGQWVFGGRERGHREKIFMPPVVARDEQSTPAPDQEMDPSWIHNP